MSKDPSSECTKTPARVRDIGVARSADGSAGVVVSEPVAQSVAVVSMPIFLPRAIVFSLAPLQLAVVGSPGPTHPLRSRRKPKRTEC